MTLVEARQLAQIKNTPIGLMIKEAIQFASIKEVRQLVVRSSESWKNER
jgi:hypothetical protein